MIRISNDKISALGITSSQKIKWVNDCLLDKKLCTLPAKTSLKENGHVFYNIMPTIMKNIGVAGVKVVNRYPDRTPTLNSEMMLYDYESGLLKALIQADNITAMRTGAVAVHSINTLAIKTFKTVALLGLGEMMYETFKIFCDEYKGRDLTIKIYKYKNHAEKFINNFSYSGFKFVAIDNYDELMSDSDVIISAITFAEECFCNENIYKKGCLLIPIHTRGFQNCDRVFDKIFGDDYSHIEGFQYFNEFPNFTEISQVLNDFSLGRSSDDERIIAYNIGLAIHDVYYGNKILEMINSHNTK